MVPAFSRAQAGLRAAGDTALLLKHEFSVQQAVDYALKNNVNVKNSLLDVKIQNEINRQVTANAYPHINGSLGTTYNASVATQVIPNFISPATYSVLIAEGVKDGNGNTIQMPGDFGFIAAQFGTKYSANAAISLNQILFDGQVFVGLQARDASIKLAEKTSEVTQEMIKANVHKIYYQLVLGKSQLSLLDANIVLTEKNLSDTRIIYENGFREKLDVDKASVQLANLQTERTKIVNLLSNGYYALKLLMGMPIHDELILTDSLTENQIQDGVLDAVAYSYEDRKEYQLAQTGKQMNEFNIKRYKLSQIPTVSLSGVYAKNAQRDKWNFFGKGDWFAISNVNLNITVPIFNGYFTKSKIQQSKIDLQKTNNQIAALKLSIDNEVVAAKNNYLNAVNTLEFQKKNMELSEKVYQQTKKKYETGTGSQIEIELAQTSLKAAQTNFISSLYDAIIAKVDFLKATGKL
ncbi:MAG: TolC family protein [Chitinophagaceae bacterium]|nr:TolC family protein [Chitinophagaceae bacterium]